MHFASLDFFASNRRALDPMGVVNQPVEDAVSQGGSTDLFVPARDWQLRSQDH
jgi:hypothetical protein